MKKANLFTKLSLNKNLVAILNDDEAKAINGGACTQTCNSCVEACYSDDTLTCPTGDCTTGDCTTNPPGTSMKPTYAPLSWNDVGHYVCCIL